MSFVRYSVRCALTTHSVSLLTVVAVKVVDVVVASYMRLLLVCICNGSGEARWDGNQC